MVSRAEQENVMRSLREEKLIVSSITCRWGWHKWSQWSDPRDDSYGVYKVQYKNCVHCNQLRATRVGHL